MAKWVFSAYNFTPTSVAAGANPGNGTYMDVHGGSATQTIDFLEVKIDGGASASAWTPLTLSRTSTVSSGQTALAIPNAAGPMHPATAALAAAFTCFWSANTEPQRSTNPADGKLDLGLNAFGGIVRWNAAPTQQWTMLGTTTQFGDSLLSSENFGAPGAVSVHIIFEPY